MDHFKSMPVKNQTLKCPAIILICYSGLRYLDSTLIHSKTVKLTLFVISGDRDEVIGIENCCQNFDSLLLMGWLCGFTVQKVHQHHLIFLPGELGTQWSDAADSSLQKWNALTTAGAQIPNIWIQNPFKIWMFYTSVLEWFHFGLVGTIATGMY